MSGNKRKYQDQADTVDLNEITSCPHKVEVLRRLKESDSTLMKLIVCDEFWERNNPEPYYDEYVKYVPSIPNNQHTVTETKRDAGWLGHCIGKNTVLETLMLCCDTRTLNDFDKDIKPFCEGLSLNRSIKEIRFNFFMGGSMVIFRELEGFFKNNHQLTSISIQNCGYGVGIEEIQMLTRAIAGCHSNLKEISIWSMGDGGRLEDTCLAHIIRSLEQLKSLRALSISYQHIERNSCNALAHLLQLTTTDLATLSLGRTFIEQEDSDALIAALQGSQLRELNLGGNRYPISLQALRSLSLMLNNPDSNLESLSLRFDNIGGDHEAFAIVEGMARNKKLKVLCLFGNRSSYAFDAGALEKLLCDTSSINKTFLSSHSLVHGGFSRGIDTNSYYLELNRNLDKKLVGAVKILKNHDHFDMHPLFEWDFKVLPRAIGWLEKASTYDTDFEKNIAQRKLSVVYQFVRAMPMLCIESWKL